MDIAPLLVAKRKLIEQNLETMLNALPTDAPFQANFIDALKHAIHAGGKRVRPTLTLLVADACEATPAQQQDAIAAALAIELLHNYTLVHDDLPSMDNDTQRRGAPSVWAKYGEGVAILAGDTLQALAFQQIAGCKTAHHLLPLLAKAALQVVHGQIADIGAATVDPKTWDTALLGYVFLNKTAMLIATACALGAAAAEASPEIQEAMFLYGQNVGLAFQYIDDLLDAQQSQQGNELSALVLYDGDTDALRTSAQYCTQQALKALNILPSEKALPLASFAQSLLDRLL